MPIRRKPLEIPPDAARQFIADMQAYFAERSDIKRGEIAVRTRHMLLDHMPAGTKLPLNEVMELFDQMKAV